MVKSLILSVMIILVVNTAPAYPGTGFKSDFDILWNITVSNCSGREIVYTNCLLVEKNLLWISFVPDQNVVSGPHGKEIRISIVGGCTSIIMEQSD